MTAAPRALFYAARRVISIRRQPYTHNRHNAFGTCVAIVMDRSMALPENIPRSVLLFESRNPSLPAVQTHPLVRYFTDNLRLRGSFCKPANPFMTGIPCRIHSRDQESILSRREAAADKTRSIFRMYIRKFVVIITQLIFRFNRKYDFRSMFFPTPAERLPGQKTRLFGKRILFYTESFNTRIFGRIRQTV